MADLIVRGMSMPENCAVCQFWDDCSLLAKAGFEDWVSVDDAVEDGDLVRLEGCPLVPLPECHGRLIDADAPVRVVWSDGTIHSTTVSRLLCMHSLLDFPKTIVPSEEGDADG